MALAFYPNERAGAFATPEGPLPLKPKTALVVVADMSCPSLEECRANVFHMGIRHENNQFEKLPWLGLEHLQILQPQPRSNFGIHPRDHIIQVGVNGIDGHIVSDRGEQGALHTGAACYGLQPSKDHRVVGDHQIATAFYRFGNYFFGAIQSDQR